MYRLPRGSRTSRYKGYLFFLYTSLWYFCILMNYPMGSTEKSLLFNYFDIFNFKFVFITCIVCFKISVISKYQFTNAQNHFFSLNSRYVIIVCDDSILNFSTECQPNQISCDTDRCIDVSFLCDGYSDCEDTTDEAQCGTCASCNTS